ncbi:LOB domain-containing protein 1-like [Andrographis paniculata]|uniref:LOB domain-containing protein 1-like n=1 Tax=Andrographis paniculata TaxID=175694 RepID=UPI0021E91FA1|nr:LOB domain-containing protein 1-like [Andrographis paniculata]
MKGSEHTNTNIMSSSSSSSPILHPQSQSQSQSQVVMVISPCAACKILRRRCTPDKCVLAPYFPPNDPLKFTTAHRVFGASNIIKFLQELPETQRADAVSSMVYEANARLRDPVYGCAGAICQLQKQVNDLKEQLAKAKAEIVSKQCQHDNLMALIYMQMTQSSPTPSQFDDFANSPQSYQSNTSFLEESNIGLLWEPLWTS